MYKTRFLSRSSKHKKSFFFSFSLRRAQMMAKCVVHDIYIARRLTSAVAIWSREERRRRSRNYDSYYYSRSCSSDYYAAMCRCSCLSLNDCWHIFFFFIFLLFWALAATAPPPYFVDSSSSTVAKQFSQCVNSLNGLSDLRLLSVTMLLTRVKRA